jgi:GNAT superfamily N-acetyltransferase
LIHWLVERFRSDHVRSEFSCGVNSLDNFIRLLASQYEQRSLGKTYVAVAPGASVVRGYYTIVAGSVPFESMPQDLGRKLPRHPVPVVLIGRLAVAKEFQGRHLGASLLRDSLRRAVAFAEDLGIHAALVDAIDEKAASFYRKYGFVSLEDQPNRLILPISKIAALSSVL